MLKRNGQRCQYEVAGFSGRLTASEFDAYNEATPAVEDQIRALNDTMGTLAEIERQIPPLVKLVSSKVSEPAQYVEVEPGSRWQVRHTLAKCSKSEILLCSHEAGQGSHFAVIERFDPNSAYARANGACEIHMTSNSPRILLQDYVEQERGVLQMFRNDILATVEEVISERHPDQKLNRVVKAVSARCNKPRDVERDTSFAQETTNDVKVRI